MYNNRWCPPCKAFTPKLIEFYEALKKKKDAKFEIVYVSSDKNLDEFQGYYGKMPWLAVPTDAGSAQIKNDLAAMLKIRGIPTLVVLDVKTGRFVTDQARNEVMSSVGSDPAVVYAQWKEKEPVPIEEASLGGGGGGPFGDGPIGKLIWMILKNPMYIFAMIYIIKNVMRKWKQSQGGGDALTDEADAAEDAAGAAGGAGDESEF